MKNLKINGILLSFFGLLFLVSANSWAKTPLELLTLAKGTVEYSKDGVKWKRVTRNKLVFDGYRIRTADDGSAKFINQNSGSSRDISAGSEVLVEQKGISVISGTLSQPNSAENKLFKGMKKRFAKAQRYTTVRRSVSKSSAVKLESARKLVLSAQFPELVWSNMGSDYQYRLTIDGNSQTIEASDGAMIRTTVNLTPGKHVYGIELMKDGELVYSPKRKGELTWLDAGSEAQLSRDLADMVTLSGDDDFMMGIFLEDSGLTVAAMDRFRHYFVNEQDNDLRPMLIKVYHSLKLTALRQTEAQRYNAALAD